MSDSSSCILYRAVNKFLRIRPVSWSIPSPAHLFLLAITAMVSVSCAGGSSGGHQIFYVSSTAMPGGDGVSWETAFTHPQDALDIAVSGDQVWVSEGEYGPRGAEDRSVIVLGNGVMVLGGFKGNEYDENERKPEAASTVLNGQDYAYHVVLAIGAEGAVLDGFTITGGKAAGCDMESDDGGMFDGGGVFSANSALEIRQCRFSGNAASHKGGAVYSEDSEMVLMDCTFEMNSAAFGGALNNNNSSSTVINSIFNDNRAEISGGAISDFGSSSSTYVNTVFSGNRSCWTGGAVLSNSSSTVFTNCTFNGNRCQMKPGGALSLYEGNALLINCILWGDTSPDPSEIWTVESLVEVNYSIVEGGSEGNENLGLKPEFIRDGFWDETDNWVDGDYGLSDGSPGIDSGTADGAPNFDLAGILRPQELAHDRGAYEHSKEE